jgi:hypothetical protein
MRVKGVGIIPKRGSESEGERCFNHRNNLTITIYKTDNVFTQKKTKLFRRFNIAVFRDLPTLDAHAPVCPEQTGIA